MCKPDEPRFPPPCCLALPYLTQPSRSSTLPCPTLPYPTLPYPTLPYPTRGYMEEKRKRELHSPSCRN